MLQDFSVALFICKYLQIPLKLFSYVVKTLRCQWHIPSDTKSDHFDPLFAAVIAKNIDPSNLLRTLPNRSQTLGQNLSVIYLCECPQYGKKWSNSKKKPDFPFILSKPDFPFKTFQNPWSKRSSRSPSCPIQACGWSR